MITVINFIRFWNEKWYRELIYVSKATYEKNHMNYSKAKQNFNFAQLFPVEEVCNLDSGT